MPAPPPPPPAAGPRPERRRFRRLSPEGARVWLVSGEFDELYTTVNFGKRLLNIGSRGCCIETTGRLRPEVLMSVEVRFESVNGALRAPARIVWTDTKVQGGQETHLAGFRFEGEPEMAQTVRELLGGVRPTMIMEQRSRDYEELKRKAEERKKGPEKPAGRPVRRVLLLLFFLLLAYGGSFAGLVARGRLEAPPPEIRFRYAPGGDPQGAERGLAAAFGPAYAAARACGIPLTYVPP